MERIDRILAHALFREYLEKNREAEKDRIFCRHEMTHFLDVARIGRIINLEERLGVAEELIYAAALLHDIGKHLQYSQGIPHEKAGAELAPEILRDCGFDEKETGEIAEAIMSHRTPSVSRERGLRGILYRADKASRLCLGCPVIAECHWEEKQKNQTLLY